MHVYTFERGSQVAITRDPEGLNLPDAHLETWKFREISIVNGADIERLGATVENVIRAIEDRGYYILPAEAGS